MSDVLLIIEYCAGSAVLTLMIIALGYSIAMPAIDRWSKNFFIIFFSVLTLCVSTYFIDAILYGNPSFVGAEEIILFLESLSTSTLMPMSTILLLHYCGEKFSESILLRTVIALWIVYVVMAELGHFTGFFYILSPDNQFIRTEWFPFLLTPLTIIMILNVAGVIRRRKKLPKRYFIALMIYLLPMTIAVIIHSFFAVYFTLFLCIGICALSMYTLIISDQIIQIFRQQREMAEKEREIAHQRASVMVLQMRPHFIYNTMMSIYYLCKQDADKAQQVTLDFTTYLRKNFTAIAGEDTISFKDELEHTRAYLTVEQAQHEGMLYVDYDTPHVNFSVPPLTLQPLVENAVKLCLDPNGEALRIFVKTRLTDSGSEITVENNGADFKPSDDNEPHIALANIEQRLEMMCGGKMTITPREGGGTVVKVIIPKK